MRHSNYDKFPFVPVPDAAGTCVSGWSNIAAAVQLAIQRKHSKKTIVIVECYPGVDEQVVLAELKSRLKPVLSLRAREAMYLPERIDALVAPFLGDEDSVFGFMSNLALPNFFDIGLLWHFRDEIENIKKGVVLIVGCGASLIAWGNLLIYADLSRREARNRFRSNAASNLGVDNHALAASQQNKRAFFVDWRVADSWKRPLIPRCDFVLDTNDAHEPKLADGEAVRSGLREALQRPFRVVPHFDTAPWGGKWLQEVCGLLPAGNNYGSCVDCVAEENSLILGMGDMRLEIPALNLVFYQPRALLGDMVYARFGHELPIRFRFLDSMGGGHPPFQVCPFPEYLRQNFGIRHPQDESYYLLDAGANAGVYLGLKTGTTAGAMIRDLTLAGKGDATFAVDQYVNRFPARKHDHYLIPSGTVHCCGADSMVLEISGNPGIFRFGMWGGGQLESGRPQPTHVRHGVANVQWDRTTDWTKANLVNRIEPLVTGDGWREERTGLHERKFIETRRHWFTRRVTHHTHGGVNVLNLVEGEEVVIESPAGGFAPFLVHYAETFIVPAAVGEYTVRPHGPSVGKECVTLKAFVCS